MHEMAICESLLGVIEDAARANGASKITRVRLEIGRFAGVEPEALRFGFGVVTAKSVAAGAALEIIDLPGRAWCFDCGETVEIAERIDPCPLCGGAKLQATGGEELRVKDMEAV